MTETKFRKSMFIKGLVSALCIIMCLTVIPFINNGYARVSAATSIEIGEYVQMGTYYGEPILWRCVDIDENGPLMLSDKILCLKAFDASGDVTTGSHGRGDTDNNKKGDYRQKYGSNCWEDSNIRCWLNSTASAGNVSWSCGNKPDASHMFDGNNEYDKEAGFLTNFTQSERNCMKSVSQYQLLDYKEYDIMSSYGSTYHRWDMDIGDCVTNFEDAYKKKITDTMFLLDVRQVNKVYQNRGTLGSDYYKGEPTAECLEQSEYKSSSLKDENYWTYWLRSPHASVGFDSGSVGCVLSDGSVGSVDAYCSSNGVRPAFYLNLSSMEFVSGNGTEDNPYHIEKQKVSNDSDKNIVDGSDANDISEDGNKANSEDGGTIIMILAIIGIIIVALILVFKRRNKNKEK